MAFRNQQLNFVDYIASEENITASKYLGAREEFRLTDEQLTKYNNVKHKVEEWKESQTKVVEKPKPPSNLNELWKMVDPQRDEERDRRYETDSQIDQRIRSNLWKCD